MNLQRKRQSEEEMIVERLTREPREYSDEVILDTSREMDLSQEEVKRSLAYYGVGKKAAKKTFRKIYEPTKYFLKAIYLPFSLNKNNPIDKEDDQSLEYLLQIPFPIALNIVAGVALGFAISSDHPNLLAYLTAHLGIVASDGLYNLYQREKKKLIKERLSKLEQITNGDE